MTAVTMEPKVVKEMAERVLALIKEHREREMAALVAEERRSWWGRWVRFWKKRDLTPEEVYASEGGITGAMFMIDMYAWRDEQIATRLAKAAAFATGPMLVSSSDLARIAP